MSPTGSALAIFFDEGDGYVFVSHLGHGRFGNAMLVRSCAEPHNLYVRKRVKHQERKLEYGAYHDEVALHRRFEYIPKLVDWTSYGRTSYSMTLQYCNGGTLHHFRDVLFKKKEPISELMIWQIFTHLLKTLEYLHHHKRSVAHGDVHAKNVFLHWPEDQAARQKEGKHDLPDIYLGDFGIAKPNFHPTLAQNDLRMLHTLLVMACFEQTRVTMDLTDYQDAFPGLFSPELLHCLSILPEPWNFRKINKPLPAEISTAILAGIIKPIARTKMLELQARPQTQSYRFTKPSMDTEVKLGESRSDFDSDLRRIDQPFYFAVVDEQTKAFLKLDEESAPLRPANYGRGCIHN